MKTMHRTSTLTQTLGAVLIALGALAFAALTHTGTNGAYALAIAGLLVFMLFLMWPERNRFRGRPARRNPR